MPTYTRPEMHDLRGMQVHLPNVKIARDHRLEFNVVEITNLIRSNLGTSQSSLSLFPGRVHTHSMLSIIGVDLTFRVFNLCRHVGSDQMPNGGLELIVSPFQFYEDRYEFIGYLIDMDMEKDLVCYNWHQGIPRENFRVPYV